MSVGRSIFAPLQTAWLLVAMTGAAFGAEPGVAVVARTTAPQPPLPSLRSPLRFFRDLLAMPPAQRDQQLASRPPQSRQIIFEKLLEYEALPLEERELRLRTTELSWYLKQLMTLAAPQRSLLLTNLAPSDREFVETRLAYWDRIPAQQQQRLVENETVLKFLSQIRRGGGESTGAPGPEISEDLGRFRRLRPSEREKVVEQFKHLFELNERERSHVVIRRPGPEREQLERALIQLQQIHPAKQAAYVDAVNRFAVMTPEEQSQFLQSAERWKKLSAEERSAWRALFAQSPPLPELPPLPPGFDPLAPPPLPPGAEPSKPVQEATNNPVQRKPDA